MAALTIRQKHRLREFGNRVLWRIFGPIRDEVTEGGENSITTIVVTYSLRLV
jgi:hypothetical protein